MIRRMGIYKQLHSCPPPWNKRLVHDSVATVARRKLRATSCHEQNAPILSNAKRPTACMGDFANLSRLWRVAR
jgi:hypothetical protein